MFAPKACGLRLLCDAIGPAASLECNETLESPKRKRRSGAARVSFCDTPCIREYEAPTSASLWSLQPSTDHSPIVVDGDGVDLRLQEAEMNRNWNRMAGRYGTLSPITQTTAKRRQKRFELDYAVRKEEGNALSQAARSFAGASANDEAEPGRQRVCH